MTVFGATLLTAAATVILAVGAIITAVLAKRAFDKQSEEVRILQRQANDSAKMLRIQSGQLDAQHDQLHSLQKVSEKQIEVLGLQATDLRESLEERKRDTAQRRRAQASRVFVTELRHPYIFDPGVVTGGIAYVKVTVTNSSPDPVYDTQLQWHMGSAPHGDPNPEPVGTILPGAEVTESRSFPRTAKLDKCGATVVFHDATGLRWRRRPDGNLAELD